MDFRQTAQPNEDGDQPGITPSPTPVTPHTPVVPEHKFDRGPQHPYHRPYVGPQWVLRVLSVILLVSVACLLIGVTFAISRVNTDNESKFVISSDYQAVFLNNGSVYFGNIDNLNNNYIRLANVYYLTSGTSSTNYSLVQLGCQQIQDPVNEMVINRAQVAFWENLDNSGKVVSSIKQFQQENSNGLNCAAVSTQMQASTSSGAIQNSTSTTSTTTGTDSTK